MKGKYASVAEVLAHMSAQGDKTRIWNQVISFAFRFGYSNLAVVRLPARQVHSAPEMIFADPYICNDEVGSDWLLQDHQNCWQAALERKYPQHTHAPLVRFVGDEAAQIAPLHVLDMQRLVVPIFDHEVPVGVAVYYGESADASSLASAMLHVVTSCAFLQATKKPSHAPSTWSELSIRERQCLSYIASSFDDDEIANLLGISRRTVRFHVDSAKRKLGVRSRVNAVLEAIKLRYIQL